MKFSRKTLASSIAASLVALGGFSPVAHAEVSASVGIASSYLWRGYDLGSGTPAIFGGLQYDKSGFYTGVWGSSGDTAGGTEYDIYAGYGLTFGEDDLFSLDVSLWNYLYPTGESDVEFGDLSELVVSFGVGPVSLSYYDNIAGNPGYAYYSLSGSYSAFTLAVGMHDNPEGEDPIHIDLSYAFNDSLSFTLSQFIADEPADDKLKFVVSYSLPIGE
jgi:uncharacterized protein (TIGR02001 family)